MSMFQIQDIKLNNANAPRKHCRKECSTESIKNVSIEITKSVSLPSINIQHSKEIFPAENEQSENIQRKISLTDGLLLANTSKNHVQFDSLGEIRNTLNKDFERRNIANNVVKLHFVNRNYHSNSDSSEIKWCESETSLESNEYDRRFYETKQWQANLFYYPRSDAAILLNHRVHLKFQQLEPFIIWKHVQSSKFTKNQIHVRN